ncbi:OsmC family protein [Pseudocolwellia sp. HL-MZ19]|uniref:OsmC family protein n=1 Tax=unclassified Pseudocolwellia TaxID=2848178 RepID=UPI003CEF4930
MSTYFAQINWAKQDNENYLDNKYSHAHTWSFDGGAIVAASSSPHIVPLPYSVETNVDPEEAFIASISSCHMLFFLSIAAKNKLIIECYEDKAEGVMEKDIQGHVSITKVTLKPKVTFSADTQPVYELLEKMHHQAHQQCFIANSVKADVVTEIQE